VFVWVIVRIDSEENLQFSEKNSKRMRTKLLRSCSELSRITRDVAMNSDHQSKLPDDLPSLPIRSQYFEFTKPNIA